MEIVVQAEPIQKEIGILQPEAMFCEDCGNKLSKEIQAQIYQNGVAFCIYCGKGYRLSEMEVHHY